MKNLILILFLVSQAGYAGDKSCKVGETKVSKDIKPVIDALRKPASVVLTGEECEYRIGLKPFFIQAKTGTLKSDSTSEGYELVYWKDNELQKVEDAKITVLKKTFFDQEQNITSYAIKFKVESKSTELFPADFRPAMHSVTFSTMCKSVAPSMPSGAVE